MENLSVSYLLCNDVPVKTEEGDVEEQSWSVWCRSKDEENPGHSTADHTGLTLMNTGISSVICYLHDKGSYTPGQMKHSISTA